MMATDPNIATLELMVAALGDLCNELVLVGGCSVGLLITESARPPVRHTVDVDLVAEVVTLQGYYAIADRLRECGFQEDASAEHLCRWRKGELILDLMPSEEGVFNHSTNRWYPSVVRHAQRVKLPSGNEINTITGPLFLATKLDSFHDRAKGDYTHHDMEDIINVVDGREELIAEVAEANAEVREYIRDEVDDLLADQAFVDSIPLLLLPDAANQARYALIVGKLRELAGL